MAGWQNRVLKLVSGVPEASGAGALVRNSMSKITLEVVGEMVDGVDTMPPDVKSKIEKALSSFEIGRAGQLIFFVGEMFPAWKFNIDTNEIEWQVFSPAEFQVEQGKPAKILNNSDKFVDLPPGLVWYRTWEADPSNRNKSWSPHKSLIDLLEAMYLHQLADTAVATSRLAGAGILYWPTNLPSLPLKDGRPEEGSQEELQMQLSKAMTDSINERNGADAIVPMVVFGDTNDQNQKPEHILLERPDSATNFAARMVAYRERYATGVELPVESVTGIGAANHWTAWVVKEDKWRFYLAPIADVITKGLTRNFAKPFAQQLGYDGPINVVANGKALIAKPDRTDAAIRLAQIGGFLNDEAVIREAGFDPTKDAGTGIRESNGRLKDMPVSFRDTSPSG